MTCPTFASYKAKLDLYCQIDREIAVQSNNIEAFITKWDPFLEQYVKLIGTQINFFLCIFFDKYTKVTQSVSTPFVIAFLSPCIYNFSVLSSCSLILVLLYCCCIVLFEINYITI